VTFRPDQITGPESRRPALAPALREAALALPNLVKLIARLLRDDRVPTSAKLFAGGMALYVVSPVDLVPEAIFGPLGLVDDLLLAAYALDRLIKVAGPQVVAEHWDGSAEVVDLIETILDLGSHLVPRPVRTFLQRFGG
jgi:uncharacterized membrane protein YkvA (DUF1232 family)